MKSVKLSELKFKDFGLDIKKNFLNPSKCECGCDAYGLMKCDNTKELQDSLCHLVCESGKYPCGVVVIRKDNTVLVGFSHKEKPTLLCGYRSYAFKDAPKEWQYLSVGELVTKTYELEHYGIMIELEDNFYQTVME
ncbi:hypothetical protein DWW33_04205 [Roseburia sp. AF15-21]|uniref:hypothetical protein n=1 Tax=Roseburia sp. AF15-21 TaxID=2293128 RepID=UPI000E518165|nr:hypothetical protein [Roseburia sp. AF15-21]RHR89463.1 hypothetical protein DWW33_04205 [Roseburia sp. AF15-21]